MCEKDVRFQEQVQKHEEELLRATSQSQLDVGLQQVRDSGMIRIKYKQLVVCSFISDPHKSHNS